MKLFGKRRQPAAPQEAQVDPINSYAVTPLPRQGGPPASSTPLADALAAGGPGVTDGYVVVPRVLAENMPLPWQQRFVQLIGEFADVYGGMSWPQYRVLPSRRERLVDLDEEQLAEVGYVVELDAEGALVYRERNGRKVADPENTVVLVTCLDPVTRRPPDVEHNEPQQPQQRPPAQMNIGPQPVWDVVPPAAATDAQQTGTPDDAQQVEAPDTPQSGVADAARQAGPRHADGSPAAPRGDGREVPTDTGTSSDADAGAADLDTPPKGFPAPVTEQAGEDTPPRGVAPPAGPGGIPDSVQPWAAADRPRHAKPPAAEPVQPATSWQPPGDQAAPGDAWPPPKVADAPTHSAWPPPVPAETAPEEPRPSAEPSDAGADGPPTPQEASAGQASDGDVDWFAEEPRQAPQATADSDGPVDGGTEDQPPQPHVIVRPDGRPPQPGPPEAESPESGPPEPGPPEPGAHLPFTELPPAAGPETSGAERSAPELEQQPPSFGPTGEPIERPWRPR